MTVPAQKDIFTIGHSTRTLEHFISMLHSFDIQQVTDIRGFPVSKRYPHFNKAALEVSLPNNNIDYIHLKKLGGRRPAEKDSLNTAWRHPAFRGFADYMQTDDFINGIAELEEVALVKRTAYMCSEALWWSCHRSMVSDYLKWKGWNVYHIMEINKAEAHHYTQPAKITEDGLSYH